MAFPPVAEQQEIIRRVQALFTLNDRIHVRLAKAKIQIDTLTESILDKAFRGDLVQTEAELAKLEGRQFESAQELLERISRQHENGFPFERSDRKTRGKEGKFLAATH